MTQVVGVKDAKKRDFILNGNLLNVIIKITFPLALMHAFDYVYGIVDTIMVANISSKAVSAVVIITQLKALLSAIATGLASGGTIYVARLIGRNDYDKAKSVANSVIALSFIIGGAIVAIVVPLAPTILRLAKTPESLIEVGGRYFVIQIVAVFLTVINNVYLGLEKARGNTQRILWLNVSVMAVKIGLTAIFVYVCNYGINMVAVATLIANGLLTVFVIARFASKNYLFRFRLSKQALKLDAVRPISILSFPIFLGRFVFSLGKVVINSMCHFYGDTVVGALGVSNNLGGSITNFMGSVEDSESAIISQNLGNNNIKRATQTFYYTLGINLVIGAVGVTLLTIFNDQIVALFAGGDAEFAALISKIFAFEKIGVITLGINSAVLGLLYGFGYTRTSMVINLARVFVFRVPSLLILQNFTNLGSESVGVAMMISNVGIGVVALVVAVIYLVKIKRHGASVAIRGEKPDEQTAVETNEEYAKK